MTKITIVIMVLGCLVISCIAERDDCEKPTGSIECPYPDEVFDAAVDGGE